MLTQLQRERAPAWRAPGRTTFGDAALKAFRLLPAIGAAVLLSACASLNPEPLTAAEVAATISADRTAAERDMEPLSGPLTLEDAIARAVKYNAGHRLRMMEEAVASGTYEVSRYDLLPKVLAGAGYRYRDEELISLSEDSVTGEPSLANPFISSSREATTTELAFSWSLLDFGQSYYAARQNADRVLIARERRRKGMHTLIQDVRTAFLRAASAQQLSGVIRQTIGDAEAALDDAERVERVGLRSPLEPLRYQRHLLESLRLLELIDQELATARVELAALINLPLGQDFSVIEPDTRLNTAWLDVPVAVLEEQALTRNPDLRESMYDARIARAETRRVLLKLFPGISFNYGHKTSDDEFLINQSWNEAGVQISFDLLGLLSAPARMRLVDAGVALADQQRVATQMAVLTQLHIARLQYAHAVRNFERADDIAAVDKRIAEHVSNRAVASTLAQQERVAQQTATIVSVLRRYEALSDAQAAAARLQATLGLEPNLDGAEMLSLNDLSDVVAESLETWTDGTLPASTALAIEPAR